MRGDGRLAGLILVLAAVLGRAFVAVVANPKMAALGKAWWLLLVVGVLVGLGWLVTGAFRKRER